MNSELYKLLMTYKGLDDDFIYKAYEILMGDEDGLEPYIKDFEVVNEDDNSLASYNSYSKKIAINTDGILNAKSNIKNKKLLALRALRYEIEKAKNIKRVHEGIDDIETVLVRYGNVDYARTNGLYPITSFDQLDPTLMAFRRYENYHLNPSERIADIKSWKYLVNLLKNQRRTDDLLAVRSNLYYAYVQGYKNNGWYLNPPTYEYLLGMRMMDEYYSLKKRVEAKQYVFDTRLLLGLPLIDGSEHDKKILEKVKLQKRKQSK